ncbi:MAG: nucleotide exchange factor GrpE [archaeon]
MSDPEVEDVARNKTTVSKTTFVSIKELDKLKEALEQEKKESNECLLRLKHIQADFENLQKRTKKEMEEVVRYGNEGLVTKLLPVLDDLERALNATKETGNREAILDGVELILKGIQATLFEVGVSQIEAVGTRFDPSIHEAIGYVEAPDQPENIIVREFRKGYRLGDKVIRHSVVEVSRRPK